MITCQPHILFKDIKHRPYSFFLDSAAGHKKISSRSFMGSDPFLVFKSKRDSISLEWNDGRSEHIKGNPFYVLKDLFKKFSSCGKKDTSTPFTSGAVGYFGYDMKDFIEKLPNTAIDDIKIPDCIVGFYDKVLSYSNSVHRGCAENIKLTENHSLK